MQRCIAILTISPLRLLDMKQSQCNSDFSKNRHSGRAVLNGGLNSLAEFLDLFVAVSTLNSIRILN